jgi:SAM-dependent methyltransferase
MAVTSSTIEGPFGPAQRETSLSISHIAAMYELKCGIDVRRCFPTESLDLYKCQTTGYRFWRPVGVAGDEQFYRDLSAAWPQYYPDWRWEYQHVPARVKRGDRLLEIGSGRGYFLRFIEERVKSATGLELNREAIVEKVCRAAVLPMTIEAIAAQAGEKFDVVCSFQVLEHIPQPDAFLRACVAALAPCGQLILSTPNSDHVAFQRKEDAFDLPPHHIGHFSLEVYAKLAKLYGLELERVFVEPQEFSLPPVTEQTAKTFSSRAMCYAMRIIGQTLYDLCGEPGPSLLVVLRK